MGEFSSTYDFMCFPIGYCACRLMTKCFVYSVELVDGNIEATCIASHSIVEGHFTSIVLWYRNHCLLCFSFLFYVLFQSLDWWRVSDYDFCWQHSHFEWVWVSLLDSSYHPCVFPCIAGCRKFTHHWSQDSRTLCRGTVPFMVHTQDISLLLTVQEYKPLMWASVFEKSSASGFSVGCHRT
jgi:hypothetical protein